MDTIFSKSSKLLLLANVWDVPSTLAAQQAGYRAVGTSSAAIAAMLGYPDGEQLSFEELLAIVKRIAVATTLPLSVDLEAGYGPTPQAIINNILEVRKAGAGGVNLEDSLSAGRRGLRDAQEFANQLTTVTQALQAIDKDLFLNIRTDTYLLDVPNKLEETLHRIKHYEAAGADGIFVPGITDLNDVRQITAATTLPINVMCMPGLPGFTELKEAGVRRISMGNFLHAKLQQELSASFARILADQNFSSLCS